VSFPSRVRGGDPTAQRFPLFSALRMASPDTIILLTVDYHAAIGATTPVPPHPLRMPLCMLLWGRDAHSGTLLCQ